MVAIAGAVVAFVGLGLQAAVAQRQLPGVDPAIAVAVAVVGLVSLAGGLLYSALRQLRIRRHLPPERYRGPGVLVLVLLGLAFAFLVTLPFGADAAALVLGDGEVSLLGSIVLLASTQAGLLLVSWLLVLRPRALAGLPPFGGPDPGGATIIGFGAGLAAWFGATVVVAVVAVALQAIGIEPEPQAVERAIARLDPSVVVLATVVLAPIAEEIFFRGVVYNALLREAGPRRALFGSAALFGVIHLSLVAALPLFLLGIALAWVYARTRSLLAAIVMHATVNAISVALALLVRFELVPLPV